MELQYASLRELTEELTGIRLAASINNSLWNLNATITDRVRVAVNDALASKPYPILAYTNSVQLSAYGSLVVLPTNIDMVATPGRFAFALRTAQRA